jgi:anti-anti-sigma factor
MDSAALELLLDTHEALARRGGILKLVNLNEVGRDALVATRLAGVLHVYEDLHQAVRSG